MTRIFDVDRRASGDEWWLAGDRRESVKAWPRCAGCQATLSLKHAGRASRCVSCINEAGDYEPFRRRMCRIIHGRPREAVGATESPPNE